MPDFDLNRSPLQPATAPFPYCPIGIPSMLIPTLIRLPSPAPGVISD